MANTVSLKELSRRQLPSYERNGCDAYAVQGVLLVITLHQSRIDFETLGGVAANVPHKLRAIQSGIGDTVLLGFVKGEKIYLLDILMLERRSQRGLSLTERLEVLRQFYQNCKSTKEFGSKISLVTPVDTGLMKLYDVTVGAGGEGLLLHVEGARTAFLCKEY